MLGTKLPSAHSSISSAWSMADSIAQAHVLTDIKLLNSVPYVGIAVDESTSIDTVQYLDVDATFWMPKVGKKSIFLKLEAMKGADAQYVLRDIFNVLDGFKIPATKLVGVASDGASVFQGHRTGVLCTIQREYSPFCQTTHCPAHKTNLCAQGLQHEFVEAFDVLVKAISSHFKNSVQRQQAFLSVQQLLNLPEHRLLYSCQTRWLSNSPALDRLLEQFPALIKYSHDVLEETRNPEMVFVSNQLCQLELVLMLPLASLILSELNVLCKVCWLH